MPQEKTGAEEVRWDLSSIYEGPDDPRLGEDLASAEKTAAEFSERYRGRLDEDLGDALRDYIALDTLTNKIGVYLMLRQSLDLNDAAVNAKLHEAQLRLSRAAGEHLEFFSLELGDLTDETVRRQADADETVRHHLPFIRKVRMFRPHKLSEEVESALTKRGPFSADSWAEFYDEVEADLRFPWKGGEKTFTEMRHLMSESRDPEERAEALKVIDEGLAGAFHKFSAQTLNMIAGEKTLEDRERGYPHPMRARNMSNQIDDDVVEALHAAVSETGAPLTRRAYRLKARLLGVETLKWSDRNAKMPFADTSTVPWEEARLAVIDAYASFSHTLSGIIQQMFAEARVDAPATSGKRSGAFNLSTVLPDTGPVSFTLLNYQGSNRDVMTLAHELGHGVHGILAGEEQGTLMQSAPIAFAETASVFGEMTTFSHLLKKLEASGDDESRLALLMGKIDDMLNTVIRQIGFSNFERRVHGAGKKLSPDELDEIWMETVRELYGEEGDVFTYDHARRLWCYVPHFHRPFYVYGYAFGEMLTQSLYAKKNDYGDRFEPLYLDMLRAGGTKTAAELLAPFGLDPSDPDFWKAGLEVSLGRLLDEAESLSEQCFAA